jgi:hypothetical protein
MRALDTNVIARFFIDDQRLAKGLALVPSVELLV